MSINYFILPPDDVTEGQLATLANAGFSQSEYGEDILQIGYDCSDVLDALCETQEDFVYGEDRTSVTTASIAWAEPLVKRIKASRMMSCFCSMPDDDGSEAISDWLDGVTSRRTVSIDMAIPRSISFPDLHCVFDRNAEYLHFPTPKERAAMSEPSSPVPETPDFDIRPTATISAGKADFTLANEPVTAEVEERDPRLALDASAELERVLGHDERLDRYLRSNVRSLLREAPATAFLLICSLGDLYHALWASSLGTFIIERG